MLRWAVVLVVLTSGLSGPAAGGDSREGLGATLMLGAHFGFPVNDSNFYRHQPYELLDPSFGMRLGLLYRFGDYFGLGLDYTFGLYDVPDPISACFMALEAAPRVYIPAGPVDVFFDFSLGWSMFWFRADKVGDPEEDRQVHGIGLGIGVGAEYRITEYLSAGLSARYHLPIYLYTCVEGFYGQPRECGRVADVGIGMYPHDILVGANLTFYFGRLGAGP